MRSPERIRASLLKVPEILGVFWVVKLLSTAMGEALRPTTSYAPDTAFSRRRRNPPRRLLVLALMPQLQP